MAEHMNKELLQSAKDEAAREFTFPNFDYIKNLSLSGKVTIESLDIIYTRAMEIYAEKVGGYWEQRCKLAEICLKESPCDPDITSDQVNAWHNYNNFIKTTKQ